MKIVFEDTHLIVIDKPAGLLSQGDETGEASVVDLLRVHFGRHYVGLIHRLDRNTSGLMVVAKRTKAARRLTEALQNGKLIREYEALLVGKLEREANWIHYLFKNEKTNEMEESKPGKTGAKEARLVVTPLSYQSIAGETVTRAKFILETGRSHQIRVQSALSGFPLVGDRKYFKISPIQRAWVDCPRPALHSSRIEFPHPMTGEQLSFSSKLPSISSIPDPLKL